MGITHADIGPRSITLAMDVDLAIRRSATFNDVPNQVWITGNFKGGSHDL